MSPDSQQGSWNKTSQIPALDHSPDQTMTWSNAISKLGILAFQLAREKGKKQKFRTSSFLSSNEEKVAQYLVTT